MKKLNILLVVFTVTSIAFAQSVEIKDSANNTLMTVDDKGTVGAITVSATRTDSINLNTLGSTPSDVTNKLYNEGGTLKWNGNALNTGSSIWTLNGSDVYYNSGNVGIGTAVPASELHITPVAGISARLSVTTDEDVGSSNNVEVSFASDYDGSPNYAVIGQKDDGSLRLTGGSNLASPDMVITDDGKVGIGTTNPQFPLVVYGGEAGGYAAFQNSNTGTTINDGLMVGYSYNNDIAYIVNLENAPLRIGTNNQTQMIITNDGKVGIGVAVPGAKLEINGQVKITGGSPGADKVLTSDGDGLATWQAPSGGGDYSDGGEAGGADRTLGNTDNYDLGFETNNTTRLHIQNDGDIGIGTNSPGATVDIYSSSSDVKLRINTDNGSAGIVIDKGDFAPDKAYISFIENGAHQWSLGTINPLDFDISRTLNAPDGTFHINYTSGNVGINNTSPQASLHIKQVASQYAIRMEYDGDTDYWENYIDSADDYNFGYNGTLKAYINDTDGSYIVASDERLKRDIASIPSVLSKVVQLKPSNYRFKDAKFDSPLSTGLIAQDVQTFFPETVSEKNGYLSINYDAFAVIAIQAIKEQQKIIENITKRLEALESR